MSSSYNIWSSSSPWSSEWRRPSSPKVGSKACCRRRLRQLSGLTAFSGNSVQNKGIYIYICVCLLCVCVCFSIVNLKILFVCWSCWCWRILVWRDGYYNGAIKTRKTVQPTEVTTEEATLHRSQQLRELYESLSSAGAGNPARRPTTALSPEDLTESEWFYLMCVSFSFPPGVG